MTIILIKTFFITFFAAELVIALALILSILRLDICINKLNAEVLASQIAIKSLFEAIRELLEEFNAAFTNLKLQIHQKRQEYTFKFIKTSIIYGAIFLLKGKYKKMILGYEFAKEIYEGIKESS